MHSWDSLTEISRGLTEISLGLARRRVASTVLH